MKVLKLKNHSQRNLKAPKRNLNELFERGRGFLKSIKSSENILLIHHTDVDGYCSGAIVLEALKRLGKNENIYVQPAANEELEDILKSEIPRSYDKIIILDIDAPYLKEEFESFKGKILIIDHHSLRADLNSDKIVYINPRFENEETYQPTSYIAYKFLSSLVDLKDIEWVVVLGTIADFAFDDCKDLLSEWVRIEKKKDLIDTDFWKVSKKLYGVIIVETEHVIDMLLKYKSLSELSSDEKFLSAYEIFEKEYEKARKEFWIKAKEINNIIFSEIDPAFKRVGSVIVTDVGLEKEDKIIILLERRGKNFKIHGRCQSGKVHVGKLMERCCTLGGGGHRHAAGGSIKISDLKKFKNCVVSNLV